MNVSTPASIGELAHFIWECIALSIAYGLATMALLQFLKDAGVRRLFHRREFRRYLPDPQLRKDLISLATAGNENALFDLVIEKLAGQINMAAVSIIENPAKHIELLRVLAVDANPADIEFMATADTSRFRVADVAALAQDIATEMHGYSDARTRVSHHIQRTIDALQISVSQKWKRLNQSVSLFVSLLVGTTPLFLVRQFSQRGKEITVDLLVLSFFLSLLGGLLAPILRNLFSRTES